MKDAFDEDIDVGSFVLFSTGGSSGTRYVYGKIVKLHEKPNMADRVEIKIIRATDNYHAELVTRNPIVYASNVVKLMQTFIGKK